MKINKRISFPYPVLGHRKGINSTAKATLDPKIQDDYFIWDIDIEHDNDDIDELIRSGKAKYACEVECPDTFYRNSFYPEIGGDERHIRIQIKNTEIGGFLSIVVTALAVERLPGYHNSKSTGIYSNYSFDLEPGDILAIFDGWDIDLDIEASSYKRITSILQIQMVDGSEIEVNLNEKKHIIIDLPKKKYQQHIDKLKNVFFQPAMLASMVFEAFCKAYQHLSEYDTTTWARVLEHKARELGYEDIKEQIKNDSYIPYEVTRKVLDDPYYHLYNLLDDIRDNNNKQD